MTEQIKFAPQRPKINDKQLAELVRSGVPLLVGEFRGSKCDKVEYVDKGTGKPASFMKCEANVELADGTAIAVEIRLPKGVDNPANVALGVVKGQHVALRLTGLMAIKGRTSASVGQEPEAIAILS